MHNQKDTQMTQQEVSNNLALTGRIDFTIKAAEFSPGMRRGRGEDKYWKQSLHGIGWVVQYDTRR